jgi:ribosome-associated protein
MDIRKKQRVVVAALEDIKGRDILVYNTARMPSMFERVVIASGESTRQVKALADNVQEKARENGARVYGVEGEANGE